MDHQISKFLEMDHEISLHCDERRGSIENAISENSKFDQSKLQEHSILCADSSPSLIILCWSIKTSSTYMFTNLKEAIAMQEKLEVADNKLSKTIGHDITNRMIESMLAGLRNAGFANIPDKV